MKNRIMIKMLLLVVVFSSYCLMDNSSKVEEVSVAHSSKN